MISLGINGTIVAMVLSTNFSKCQLMTSVHLTGVVKLASREPYPARYHV
jgi:hypothetical protein